MLTFNEVKARPSKAAAVAVLTARQQRRIWNAGDLLLQQHPEWGDNEVRYDLLLVDAADRVHRLPNAIQCDSTWID